MVGKIIRGVRLVLLIMVLVGLTGWGAIALYFGNSTTSLLQTTLSVVFCMTGFATIIGVFLRRLRMRALGGFSLLFLVVLVWWFSISPSNDRVWQSDVAKLAYATIDGNHVTVHNIRNFTYRTEFDYTPAYYTKTYDLSKLNRVDLFVIYWMGPAIAHTIVSFGFGNEGYLAVSIEARKEKGEGYSAIKGFFRQYELIYVVADERDVIRLRTNYRKNPPEDVYMFRLQGAPEMGRQFFLEYMKEINALTKHPRFYNTLTTNCTNVIWMNAHFNPDRIPFSWKMLASGYAPEYLYEMKRLDTSIPFEELKQHGYVNPVAKRLDPTPDFSERLRAGLR